MKLDCHVHTRTESKYGTIEAFDQKAFLDDLHAAGMDGAAIYSLSPLRYADLTVEERMRAALDICRGQDTLFPFFWIDPMDEDAFAQVDLAVEKGFDAFKIIPFRFNPACQRSLDVIEKIAKTGKPIMFHTGICWDNINSGGNNRPDNYEALIEIPNLRFCLAHVSWPWYDECIALYGKFNYAHYTNPNCPEMFIDVTPGTPEVYRDEVFRHLLLSYNLREHLMFGTDCNTGDYNIKMCRNWQTIDDALYEKYVAKDVEDFKEHIYGKNLLRFLGKSEDSIKIKA